MYISHLFHAPSCNFQLHKTQASSQADILTPPGEGALKGSSGRGVPPRPLNTDPV